MNVIYAQDPNFILRISRGEEAVAEILSFCQQENITAAWVQGLGASDATTISYYDLARKEYIQKNIEEECELLSMLGNIAIVDGKPMLHAHVSLGRSDYSVIGGHLHSMRISGTGEIHITKLNSTFQRKLDEETGLKVLK